MINLTEENINKDIIDWKLPSLILVTSPGCVACPPMLELIKKLEQDLELRYWSRINILHIPAFETNMDLAHEYLIGGYPTVLVKYKDTEFTLIDDLKDYKLIYKYIIEFLKIIDITNNNKL